jgi:hypothetical protein
MEAHCCLLDRYLIVEPSFRLDSFDQPFADKTPRLVNALAFLSLGILLKNGWWMLKISSDNQ